MCIYCLITCKCIGQIYYIKSNYLYSICTFNCYLCKSYGCDNFGGSCMGCVSISRGSDQISAKFLKMAAPIIAPALTQIFNLSISKAEFPAHSSQLEWYQYIKKVPHLTIPTIGQYLYFQLLQRTPLLSNCID